MASKYPPSSDQDASSFPKNLNIQLCSKDQEKPNSCSKFECTRLHICRNYLLNKKCSKFQSDGKCSHPHSLFTLHNESVIKKFGLSAEDENIFEKVSESIRKSISNISDKSSEEKTPPITLMNTSSFRTTSSSFSGELTSDDRSASTTERRSLSQNSSQPDKSDEPKFKTTKYIEISDNQTDGNKTSEHKRLLRLNSTPNPRVDERSNIGSSVGKPPSARNLIAQPTTDDDRSKSKRDSTENDTQLKFIFRKCNKEELSYILGPVRKQLVEKESYQIFWSGYCRIKTADERRLLEKVRALVPTRLGNDRVRLNNDKLEFVSCSSAAERIFEQNQVEYSIITESRQKSFEIEVTNASKSDPGRSSSAIAKDESSKYKLRIPTIDSSITLLNGDITKTPTDLMVCVFTSVTLLDCVLNRAGTSIRSEYERKSRLSKEFILGGGDTLAKNILFVGWELDVRSLQLSNALKSLSSLVIRCIDHAHHQNMKSISFPSIGTGSMGVDVNKVCEVMINAAVECLFQHQMDVSFVIYSSRDDRHRSKTFEAFFNCLDDFSRQRRIVAAPSSSISTPRSTEIPIEATITILRNANCKRIITISDKSTSVDNRKLIQALQRLPEHLSFDLSLVQKRLIDKIESLIDECMRYNVLPCINLLHKKLELYGDKESCLQCFCNLRQERQIHKKSIHVKRDGTTDEIKMNLYNSMKMSEAINANQPNILIEDDKNNTFNIDLKTLEITINNDTKAVKFHLETLDDSSIVKPAMWSKTSFSIWIDDLPSSSWRSLDWIYTFGETMPKKEWRIEQILAIENWPVYFHYARNKISNTVLAFHGCSFSSVQSIIHYGLYSKSVEKSSKSIRLSRDALTSHIHGGRRSTEGKYYMFVVKLAESKVNGGVFKLKDEDADFALPTHLIVYQHR